jgi:hypothetical protein
MHSPSNDPRSVDVRFDSRSRGIAAQQLMSLLKLVTLINKHPDGAIQQRQFGEASQPGAARVRGKIGVELDRYSMTIHTWPSSAIRPRRLLLDGDSPKCIAQVGGKIGERTRAKSEEDDSALWIDRPRNQREGETQRRPDRYVVTVNEGGQCDRPPVLDNSQLKSAIRGGR